MWMYWLLAAAAVDLYDMEAAEVAARLKPCQIKLFLVMYPSLLVQEVRQVLMELLHQLPLCNPILWHMVPILVDMEKVQVLVLY
jgi:hypothetical protein